MTKFEFLMMIASVVVAAGMTEIIGGWGRMARTSAKVSFDWLHFGWTLVILIMGIQYWLGMWSYAEIEIGYVGQTYFLIFPSLFFVFAAYGTTPDIPLVGSFNSRTYYLSRRAAIFLPLIGMAVTSVTADFVIVGQPAINSWSWGDSIVGIFILVIATLIASRNVWLHGVVLAVMCSISIRWLFLEMAIIENRWIAA